MLWPNCSCHHYKRSIPCEDLWKICWTHTHALIKTKTTSQLSSFWAMKTALNQKIFSSKNTIEIDRESWPMTFKILWAESGPVLSQAFREEWRFTCKVHVRLLPKREVGTGAQESCALNEKCLKAEVHSGKRLQLPARLAAAKFSWCPKLQVSQSLRTETELLVS